MTGNPKINIFYPTYKNKEVFAYSLESCLRQDYENVSIHVYDNSAGDGCGEISKLINSLNDVRVSYYPNQLNIGPVANYAQIIDHMKSTDFSMCLAADIGLETRSLSLMVEEMFKNKSPVVYASSNLSTYNSTQGVLKNSYNSLDVLSGVDDNKSSLGIDIIKEYFSTDNICGEYNNFSFFGSLIYSPLLKLLSQDYLAFRFHGLEHYLSMELALSASSITRLKRPCLRAIVGAPRIGGTQRPTDFLTRIEPIMACQKFLEKYELILKNHLSSIEYFHNAQKEKCIFFQQNFTGYESEIQKLLAKIDNKVNQ
jgi:glycosyltransferase involved in cell wall biosynthesis